MLAAPGIPSSTPTTCAPPARIGHPHPGSALPHSAMAAASHAGSAGADSPQPSHSLASASICAMAATRAWSRRSRRTPLPGRKPGRPSAYAVWASRASTLLRFYGHPCPCTESGTGVSLAG